MRADDSTGKIGAIGLASLAAGYDSPRMAKTWLITGSSRGLGLAIARAALEAGENVVATARDPGQIPLQGERVRKVALDVTSPAAAKAAVAAAVEAFGRLDVVVNNAGYGNVTAFEESDEDDWRKQMETNFFGVVNVTKAALPVLRKQRSGHVIQVSSIGGRTTSPGLSAYQSAKWAVGGFSEAVQMETAPLGIRFTVVEPGGMRTDWAGSSMRVDEPGPDYEATVGAFTKGIRQNQGVLRSDPARCAAAILELAALAKPPLRLLLGTDAMFLAKFVSERRAAEDAKYAALSASSEYDGLEPFAETASAKFLQSMRD